jgi:hypothetical protein
VNKTDKAKFIAALEAQASELDALNSSEAGRSWTRHTVEILIRYLGRESEFVKSFNSSPQFFRDKYAITPDTKRAKDLIRRAIQYADLVEELPNALAVAPPSAPKVNFLYRLSEGWAIALVTVAPVLIYGVGYFMGDFFATQKIDKEKIELSSQVEKLKSENVTLTKKLPLVRANNQPRATVPIKTK